MKRTIVKIQGKKDEFTCSVNGNIIEIMGAYYGFTEHIIRMFMDKGTAGEKALNILYKDVVKAFDKIKKESEKNG